MLTDPTGGLAEAIRYAASAGNSAPSRFPRTRCNQLPVQRV